MTKLDELKACGEAPEWYTDEGYAVVSKGYLIGDETPRDMYQRVASSVASFAPDNEKWSKKYFELMWNNIFCPASPILINCGTTRGLPLSCNSLHCADSVYGIYTKVTELAMLSKHGSGVGGFFGDIRARNSRISGNGVSDGVIPWIKSFDSCIAAVNQGNVRRGNFAAYLPIEHGDIKEFLQIRRPVGDYNKQCLNIQHAVTITDQWMKDLVSGKKENRELWSELLGLRVSSGEPYIMFSDTVANADPECYKEHGLRTVTSNLCNEIFQHTDENHTLVCCLGSMNLVKFDEWKNTDAVATSIRLLDGVMEEYITKTTDIKGLECARRSALASRALGLGVLGWHSLLQDRMIAFDSFDAMMLNAQVFSTIRKQADATTQKLALELGEPLWCKGYNRRNTHTLALAPTVSNSTISGGKSPGIEPWAANSFTVKSAKGTFFRRNAKLERVLEKHNQNTESTWSNINANSGSVQHLKFLTDHEKAVFLTAREINQHAIIKQAAQRQPMLCQGQSVNLFFANNASAQYIHDVHLSAWKEKLKGLYYCRSEGVLSGDLASRSADECKACEG